MTKTDPNIQACVATPWGHPDRYTRPDHLYGSDVALARALILDAAAVLRGEGDAEMARELERIVSRTMRRRLKKKPARPKGTSLRRLPMERLYEMQNFAKSHPDWGNRQLGRKFGTDGGRFSELDEHIKMRERENADRE